ncbi:MAG: ABC transporter permease [Bacteroidota bacterium]
MLRNYLKIAFRQLRKNKFYALINTLGLATGLASCMLIYTYVQDEMSYDQFHEKKDRIYRIAEGFKTGEGDVTTGLTFYKLALDLKAKFPEIEQVMRIDYDLGNSVVEYGNKKFLQKRITSVDPGFFDFFSFKLLKGNPKTVLTDPYTVAISSEQQALYFPNEDPIGKSLKFFNPYDQTSYQATVTGVFETMPKASHFHKDFLLSTATADRLMPDRKSQLGWTSHFSYLLLRPNADPVKLEKDINNYIFKNYPKEVLDWWTHFPLQSLNDIHLKSNLKEELEPNGDMTYLYIFSAIAVIILVLACVNYTNLATAQAIKRAKEIGIRKVIGAERGQLVVQILGESLLISVFAFFVGGFIAELFVPLFNALSGKMLQIDFLNLRQSTGFLGISMLAGTVAGIYPALVLSSYQPVKVLKGSIERSGTTAIFFRKGLVVFQFAVSILLIIGTIIIYTQWDYLRNQKLGIKSGQVVMFSLHTKKLRDNYQLLKKELLKNSNIENVTGTDKDFKYRFSSYSPLQASGKKFILPRSLVDPDFFNTFGVNIKSGRGFKPQSSGAKIWDVIFNESAVKLAGFKNPIGQIVTEDDQQMRIIGVVKDFHLESLHTEISPVMFIPWYIGFEKMAIKINPARMDETLKYIQKRLYEIDHNAELQYSFLDDELVNLYQSEAKFFKVFITFSVLAIFIACLGIFGLASFTAVQRTKEIGIRKVLGASVQQISGLLIRDFVKLVVIAFVLAAPVAWWMMKIWLKNFAYQTEIQVWMFVLAGALAGTTAVLAVGFQSLRAAMEDPVKSLKSE